MLIDTILKIVLFLWFMALSGYVGYCFGLSGFGKQFWIEFLNDEREEEDDETSERYE